MTLQNVISYLHPDFRENVNLRQNDILRFVLESYLEMYYFRFRLRIDSICVVWCTLRQNPQLTISIPKLSDDD